MPEFAQPGLRARELGVPVSFACEGTANQGIGSPVEDEPASFQLLADAPPPPRQPVELGMDLDLRARIRQALVCPYCRDEVERGAESVGCVRDGCGAIYHSECWEECSADHGSCAVFGCSSQRAAPLSSAGYLLRLLRLLAAALLLPPRLVAAVEERDVGKNFDVSGGKKAVVKKVLTAGTEMENPERGWEVSITYAGLVVCTARMHCARIALTAKPLSWQRAT